MAWVAVTPRRCLSSVTVPASARTLLLVVALLCSASSTSALYLVNASLSSNEDRHPPPQSVSRCAPLSRDVLWTRLNLAAAAAPRLTFHNDHDDNDNDVEDSRTHPSPVSDHKSSSSSSGETQSSLSDTPQTVATSTSSGGWQHGRRRRGGSERRGRGRGRRRSSPTSWSCRLQKRWKRMPRGVFPTYVQTGSCRRQATCMLGMYACRPRRYLIKVLRRVSVEHSADDGCRPVPVAALNAVYEEAWSLVDVSVTVACECSRRRRSGTYEHRPPPTST